MCKNWYFVLQSSKIILYLHCSNIEITIKQQSNMKKFYTFLLIFSMFLSSVMAATPYKVGGRVIDDKGEPVGYATVLLMQGEEVVTGCTTGDDGEFMLSVSQGDYTLIAEFVGYESVERQVSVGGDVLLGDITLRQSTTAIDEVVVEATMIRREADRFVVDVTNSAAAIGKDGTELLKQSPGVRVDDDEISINGASGTKVYINDREVRLSGEELVKYVQQLRAEDISKIEIVPQTGADYDASSSGGIIKITTKRRLDNGVMGSVRMYSSQSKHSEGYNPSASINARVGKFDLSASGWYSHYQRDWYANENTTYNTTNATMNASSLQKSRYGSYGATLSAVAELNSKHTLGASFDFWVNDSDDDNTSSTLYRNDAAERLSESLYKTYNQYENYTATLNYIIKTDTLGSVVKFIADYTQRDTRNGSDNRTSISELPLPQYDSLYKNDNTGLFRVATATAARERTFSQHWQLKYGAKYTYNEINSAATYRYLNDGLWSPSVVDDYDISYAENIAAAYAVASMRYGRWSAVVGLRGEYTHTDGKGSDISQNYFSLFPNANISFALDEQGKHSLVAQYSRTISRPGFWALTPQRMQVSDYTYQTGNPLLDPAYTDSYSLTGVIAYKYSISLMATVTKDRISQMVISDPNDSRMLNLTYANQPVLRQYSMSVSVPLTLTKWWDWSTNLFGMIQEMQLMADSPITTHTMASWYTTMTFKLPCQFFIDASLSGFTDLEEANAHIKGQNRLSVSVKKKIKDNWTLVCDVYNILNQDQTLTFRQDEFTRQIRTWGGGNNIGVRFGVSWSFKSGKAFNSKSIEKGNDNSRL